MGVERFNAGTPLVLDELHGTWLLQYTTAPDVISLLKAAELPFLQVKHSFPFFCNPSISSSSSWLCAYPRIASGI